MKKAAKAVNVHDAKTHFSRLLADEDPALRGKTLTAAAYPTWPEFLPLLAAMATDDPDPGVRERAAVALAAFRRHLGEAT